MAEHELKCDPEPFDAVWEGRKTHEIRLDDRGFKVGDTLRLKKTVCTGAWYRAVNERERQPITYTGQEMLVSVKHIQTGYGLLPMWAILSIQVLSRESRSRGSPARSILPEDLE